MYVWDLFCFFKQKTAYEMRISDWSSDVCSSDLLIREMSVEPGIILVGRMGVGDAGQRLGPGQGGPLAVGIERALAPGIEQIDGFFAFTHLSCLGRVHVDAIGAAVDLRRPYLHEFDQARFETALEIGRANV